MRQQEHREIFCVGRRVGMERHIRWVGMCGVYRSSIGAHTCGKEGTLGIRTSQEKRISRYAQGVGMRV